MLFAFCAVPFMCSWQLTEELRGILTNRKELQVLEGFYQGDHEHLSWSHSMDDCDVRSAGVLQITSPFL